MKGAGTTSFASMLMGENNVMDVEIKISSIRPHQDGKLILGDVEFEVHYGRRMMIFTIPFEAAESFDDCVASGFEALAAFGDSLAQAARHASENRDTE